MRWIVLFLFLFVFALNVPAVSLDANVANVPSDFAAGKENSFFYSVSCLGADEFLESGDLLDADFWACYNETCVPVHSEKFVFEVGKIVSGSFFATITEIANNKIVQDASIVFMGKRSTEVSYSFKKIFNFGGAFLSDSFVSFPVFNAPLAPNYSVYFLIIGGVLLLVSVFLIRLHSWISVFPLIAGLVLLIFGIFP